MSEAATQADAQETVPHTPAPLPVAATCADSHGSAAISEPPGSPEEFSAVLEKVQDAAREWGIRWDFLEGRFVSALLGAVGWSGRVTQSAHAELREIFKKQRDLAELELARAREITKAANAALGQARSALINLQVERENVTLRMIHETMPMFATELRKALIYRVKDESDRLRMQRFFVAAVFTLCVFVGGFGLRAWNDSAAVGALGHCLAHPLQAQGHLYCDVTSFRDGGQ
jgi:hypothetical protein